MGANGTTEQVSSPKFLVFGRTGWIGGMLSTMLEDMGYEYKYAAARLEDRGAVMAELEEYKPTHVLNAAGVTGRPNVDWCESHKVETLRTNVIGTLNCADCCLLKGVHYTLFATGCIYEYDVEHPLGSGRGFVEDDKPNFTGSYYSRTKAQVEEMLREYSNALVLRLRMPISDEVMHPRNFIKKIVGYERVVNIPNSMTILPEMVPMAIKLAARGKTGVYNFTNPGTISHNECLELYKQYCKPDFTWKNFTIEEQAKVLAAGRSNNELDVSKLKAEFPELLPIKESIVKFVFEPYSKTLQA